MQEGLLGQARRAIEELFESHNLNTSLFLLIKQHMNQCPKGKCSIQKPYYTLSKSKSSHKHVKHQIVSLYEDINICKRNLATRRNLRPLVVSRSIYFSSISYISPCFYFICLYLCFYHSSLALLSFLQCHFFFIFIFFSLLFLFVVKLFLPFSFLFYFSLSFLCQVTGNPNQNKLPGIHPTIIFMTKTFFTSA